MAEQSDHQDKRRRGDEATEVGAVRNRTPANTVIMVPFELQSREAAHREADLRAAEQARRDGGTGPAQQQRWLSAS